MDKETLLKIAELSRLKIDDNEIQSTLEDFNKIMSYVDSINNLETDIIKDDEIYYYQENRVREDKSRGEISREQITNIAPKFENGYIVVPRVIES